MMSRQLAIETSDCGAEFSECRRWRYALWRYWGDRDNLVAFVGLNPSTADESRNDPTVTRCINYAKAWGFGGMYMLNAFAWRDTDPRGMKMQPDPVGPGNDAALRMYGQRARLVVGAWGNHGTHLGRAAAIPGVIGRPIHCLTVTSTGQPGHPLYLKSSLVPQLWTPPMDESDAKTA
jgi:hypothetical protein